MAKTITVLIPCYNEEKGIKKVIKNIPRTKLKKLGYNVNVIVIDNNSADSTQKKAREAGAKVIHEKRQGKGYALIKGFTSLPKNTDIVVMVDGDNTYDTREMLRLIEPIDSGFCDVIVGSRLHGRIHDNSMSYFNRIGNWLFTFLVRTGYQANVTDVCSGFFAWKKEVIDNLVPHLRSNGFTIEMEMITKMAKMGFDINSVPISYNARLGHSSLHPLKDGADILYTWGKHLVWSN
jgi:dolichol-phosphate mannosyltransferase